MKSIKKELFPKQRDELLAALKARFEKNLSRHPGLVWAKVQARLEAKPDKLWSLTGMERTGGEPDVVGVKSGEFVSMDSAPQSPAGGPSLCDVRQKQDVFVQRPKYFFGGRDRFTPAPRNHAHLK